MKILPVINIKHEFVHKKGKPSEKNNKNSAPNRSCDLVPVFYYPLINVSFKKAKRADFVDNIRDVPGVTCACCGIEVYPYETVSRIEDEKLFFFMPEAVKMLIKTGLLIRKKPAEQSMKLFII